jgi:N-acetyl-1-D-myo-inositol-2-amino-2-deoxy-alpha-D-glucopyranoside deacetylase
MTNKLTLIAIFAHPDDEAFGTGGTLTKYARQGVEVHLVTATLGEAGRVANPAVNVDCPLGAWREQELRCACECYGLAGLHLLGYMDGQTTVVPQSGAVYKIVTLLRRLKPQVVISFGPEGIYGHYDHLAVHRWATAAVELAGQADCWGKAGPPHRVAKFYHRAMFEEQVAQIEEINGSSFVLIDGVPFPFSGYPAEKITTVIDVSEYTQAKLAGIRCHASQLRPEIPYLRADFDPSRQPWFNQEAFILARSQADTRLLLSPGCKEDDLFAGLR